MEAWKLHSGACATFHQWIFPLAGVQKGGLAVQSSGNTHTLSLLAVQSEVSPPQSLNGGTAALEADIKIKLFIIWAVYITGYIKYNRDMWTKLKKLSKILLHFYNIWLTFKNSVKGWKKSSHYEHSFEEMHCRDKVMHIYSIYVDIKCLIEQPEFWNLLNSNKELIKKKMKVV